MWFNFIDVFIVAYNIIKQSEWTHKYIYMCVCVWADLGKKTTSVKIPQKHTVVMYRTIHFHWMFTKLYLSLKTIDNWNVKFSKLFILKNAYVQSSVYNGLIEVVPFRKSGHI